MEIPIPSDLIILLSRIYTKEIIQNKGNKSMKMLIMVSFFNIIKVEKSYYPIV